MNYLPYAGYWFYGAASSTELASYYDSYGLLAAAPSLGIASGLSLLHRLSTILGG